MTKFLIADDHPLFREALKGSLKGLFVDIEVVESDSLDSTLEALQQHSDIDLLLLDLNMPGCDHFFAVISVTQLYPNVPVAVVSASESTEIINQVMNLGAKGYIPKSTPSAKIAEAINAILKGETWLPEGMVLGSVTVNEELKQIAEKIGTLTPKQFQVLKLLQDGLLNKQIAYALEVTEATVKAHISAIFKKLDVNTRTQAVLLVEKLQHYEP